MEELKPDHSPLGASSAERWMNCPGSVALLKELKLPETDEPDYRAEGTAAHAAAGLCLQTGGDAWECVGTEYEGIVCDDTMANAVQVYLDECRKLITPYGVTLIEQHLTSRKHALMYGTVDFAHIADSLLNIVDYKHGVGVAVDVEDNPQLKYYAYLVLQDHPDVRRVVMRIVQPRGFHTDGVVRRWETTAEDICSWVEGVLLPAMLATELDHTFDAGAWCRFCPAKLVCPLMTSLFGAACNANPKNVIALNDASLGRSYQYRDAVKHYLKALEDETFRRLNLGGMQGCGVKLVHKKANRVWNEGAPVVFKARYGDKALTTPEMKSPAEMERVAPDAADLVKEWAHTPKSGLTVATEDDKRPGVKVQTTMEAFQAAAAQQDGLDIPSYLRRE